MPLPRNRQALLLAGIFGLLLIYSLYFARDMAIPVVFAVVLHFALEPVMRSLVRLHVPRVLAGLLVIVAFLACVAGFAMTLSAPAADWIAKAPQSLSRIEDRLYFLKEQIGQVQDALHQVEKIAAGTGRETAVVAVEGPGLSSSLFTGTRSILTELGTITVLLFFFLVSGDMMLRRFVEILPRLADKKQAVEITREIESQVSAYLGTIGLINAAVGVATGLAAYLCGLPDPVLWGTVAFALNFIPILGPLTGVTLLFLVGLMTFDGVGHALLPAGIYLLIHLIEGEALTPMLLARRFVLNPVLVMVSLVFWYWMWGIAGALLAVPMLAILKIVCDRVRPLMALGHFLGGLPRT
jgi:predicted PurR-regulated permease PerM